jgi:hypothetical protein
MTWRLQPNEYCLHMAAARGLKDAVEVIVSHGGEAVLNVKDTKVRCCTTILKTEYAAREGADHYGTRACHLHNALQLSWELIHVSRTKATVASMPAWFKPL